MARTPAVVLLVLSFTAAGAASGQTNTNIRVGAELVANLTGTVTGATHFGAISNNAATHTIDPTAPRDGQSTASVAVSGTPGASVMVGHTNVTLQSATGFTIWFTPSIAGLSNDTQASAIGIAPSTAVTLSDAGTYFLWVGGSVTVPGNQAVGKYEGILILSLTYN